MQVAPGRTCRLILARQGGGTDDGSDSREPSPPVPAETATTDANTSTTTSTTSSGPLSDISGLLTSTPSGSSSPYTQYNSTLTGTFPTGSSAATVTTSVPTSLSSMETPLASSSALNTNSTSTPLPATLNSTHTGHPLPIIVGASVGGAAFMLILAAILVLCLRRRARRQRIAPSSEFLHPEAQEQFRYARSAHTMSMDSGLLSASMEKFPASPPLPPLSPQLDSFFPRPHSGSPSPGGSRQSTLSNGSPFPAVYSHRARASSAGSVALSSLYVLGENGPGILRGGGSPLNGFAIDTSPLGYDRYMHDSTSDGLHIVPEDSHEIGVAR